MVAVSNLLHGEDFKALAARSERLSVVEAGFRALPADTKHFLCALADEEATGCTRTAGPGEIDLRDFVAERSHWDVITKLIERIDPEDPERSIGDLLAVARAIMPSPRRLAPSSSWQPLV
jgi:hypothetical protein